MSKYGGHHGQDAYKLPGNRYMAKAASKLWLCLFNKLLCAWCQLFIWERENGERQHNELTMNSSRMNLIDCRGHLKTMEYMKSHGVWSLKFSRVVYKKLNEWWLRCRGNLNP
jgi:hypothetical protein